MNHRGHRDNREITMDGTPCYQYPLNDVTEKIIACAIEVHRIVGPGLLEKLYEEALENEFILQGINYERQKEIEIQYKGKDIGSYRVDFVIENSVILEIKAVSEISTIFEAQLLTYLKATRKRVGLLINFNETRLKDGIRRLIV